MSGKCHHNVGRAEQEMVWVGYLATAQCTAHLAPFNLYSLVHAHILYSKSRNERSKTVQYCIIICHADDSSREGSCSMAHQAIEMQGPITMENDHYSALWSFNKHFQRPFDKQVFGLHAVHAVAEEDDIVFFMV